MIQRIQTVYLSLSIIAIALLFFFPIAYFYSELASLRFYITGIKNMVPSGGLPFPVWFAAPLMVADLAVMALAAVTISLYKDRPRQIKLTNIAVMLNILFVLALLFIYIPMIEKHTLIKADYAGTFGIYLPIISLMFLVLASRSIKRDEKLVRSSDRLR